MVDFSFENIDTHFIWKYQPGPRTPHPAFVKYEKKGTLLRNRKRTEKHGIPDATRGIYRVYSPPGLVKTPGIFLSEILHFTGHSRCRQRFRHWRRLRLPQSPGRFLKFMDIVRKLVHGEITSARDSRVLGKINRRCNHISRISLLLAKCVLFTWFNSILGIPPNLIVPEWTLRASCVHIDWIFSM